jgi:hypothetical protein
VTRTRRPYFKRAILTLIIAATLVWAGDWLILAAKVSRGANAFGDVIVRRSYAVRLRNKHIEQDRGKPAPEECVHSVFPHYNESPCWYLERHRNTTEDLDGGPWHFWAQ